MEKLIETKRTQGLRNWTIGLVLTTAAVVVCYFWLDRPIALLAHDHLARYGVFQRLTQIPEIIAPIAAAVVLVLGLYAAGVRPLSRPTAVVFLSGVSLAAATAIKDQLKFAFGRTWPETWLRDNPSFIHDGVFGFFPFHGGPGYASFPSGHTTAICSVMVVFWICYPRWRAVYAAGIAAVVIGLIGADFHFLGDTIAGGFLGGTVAWFMVVAWETGERRLRPKADAPPPTRY